MLECELDEVLLLLRGAAVQVDLRFGALDQELVLDLNVRAL